MTATLRLNDALDHSLNRLSTILNKKKCDVIRDAISFYAVRVEKIKNYEY